VWSDAGQKWMLRTCCGEPGKDGRWSGKDEPAVSIPSVTMATPNVGCSRFAFPAVLWCICVMSMAVGISTVIRSNSPTTAVREALEDRRRVVPVPTVDVKLPVP
jgi:hypothetical protein